MREEFERSFEHDVPSDLFDTAQRLSLEDIVDLAILNSRAYQTQKEILYRVALRLSLERFDYELKFATTGHRTFVDYTHDRAAGITENNLRVPTTIRADKMMYSGADMLAQFANRVLLTFNGPQGFAADIGSDLLFDISQSVFQNDIRFEALTQAEQIGRAHV